MCVGRRSGHLSGKQQRARSFLLSTTLASVSYYATGSKHLDYTYDHVSMSSIFHRGLNFAAPRVDPILDSPSLDRSSRQTYPRDSRFFSPRDFLPRAFRRINVITRVFAL